MCEVEPGYVNFLKFFATAVLVFAVVAFMTGKTYCMRVIDKRYEPLPYWFHTVGMSVLGTLMWLGILFC